MWWSDTPCGPLVRRRLFFSKLLLFFSSSFFLHVFPVLFFSFLFSSFSFEPSKGFLPVTFFFWPPPENLCLVFFHWVSASFYWALGLKTGKKARATRAAPLSLPWTRGVVPSKAAIKIERAAERCVDCLLELIKTKAPMAKRPTRPQMVDFFFWFP